VDIDNGGKDIGECQKRGRGKTRIRFFMKMETPVDVMTQEKEARGNLQPGGHKKTLTPCNSIGVRAKPIGGHIRRGRLMKAESPFYRQV